uniref:MAM domain-containing protein n=1 Tax=Steinernema glaseri TaxID=37863 RepID=A0A1I7ZGC0_9BILA
MLDSSTDGCSTKNFEDFKCGTPRPFKHSSDPWRNTYPGTDWMVVGGALEQGLWLAEGEERLLWFVRNCYRPSYVTSWRKQSVIHTEIENRIRIGGV